ncbi:cysteine--tRNA ligase [Candidatus Poribacteria bacterium]|nr:MAG: cysteine--tRNA ligase [Candidatus Poribacteria bacterium]
MSLRIYNTLTRRKEEFRPLEEGKVRIYCCGPTVYDYFHIGNARTFVFFDVVRRYLEFKGYDVRYVQNITDIDDKIINRAHEMGISPKEVADRFTQAYLEDSRSLLIKPPTVNPKATEHIPDMIELIKRLIDKGAAYVVDGDVYFDVRSFPEYGKLSGRSLDDLLAGARVEVDERKRHPEDFALWKSAKPGEPWWESPWGRGRPGWHIECSVMAMKHLGETIDIHGGGIDLIFPHHENEIAQSETATGKPFARYWMHVAFLRAGGRRMGKSEGNFIFVRDALKRFKPEAIRLFLLSAHYRSPLDYTEERLAEAEGAVSRLRNCLLNLKRFGAEGKVKGELAEEERKLADALEELKGKFEEEMDDDFNTAGAIGAIFDFVSHANKFIAENQGRFTDNARALMREAYETLLKLTDVLGIYREERRSGDEELISKLIDLIVEIRHEARQRKDWATADKIRDRLAQLGIKLQDTREGTIWRFED